MVIYLNKLGLSLLARSLATHLILFCPYYLNLAPWRKRTCSDHKTRLSLVQIALSMLHYVARIAPRTLYRISHQQP